MAGDPTEHLLALGVTGACGRTVAGLYLRAIFEAAGGRVGLVWPARLVGWRGVATARAGVPRTEGLAAMLAAMVEKGCKGAVVELDPEALAARRVEGMAFDAAIVTDVGASPACSQDALQARRSAMARLFRQVAPGGLAVVNADDPHAELLGAVNLESTRVAFGIENANAAEVSARIDRLEPQGTRFRLRGFDRETVVELRLPGATTVSHALAAAATAWARYRSRCRRCRSGIGRRLAWTPGSCR